MADKDKDYKDLNQKAVEEPADSSRTIIEDTTPPAEKEFHAPGDVGPTEHGDGTDGPANYYSEEADKQAADAENTQEKPGTAGKKSDGGIEINIKIPQGVINFGKPIVVLVAICLVVSLLLAVTNTVTEPIIAENVARAAQESRMQLLPAADNFTDVTPSALPDGITSMYEATNGAGYVIEAYATGYGGKVPAMVAFDTSGNVVGVKFLDNDETPGLGQKIVSTESFAAQYTGRPAERIDTASVDKIASATISSNAATAAVNAAIELYAAEVGGVAKETLTPEEQRAALLPDADDIQEISVDAPDVVEAYVGDDGNYIIYATAPGVYGESKPVTAAVAMTPDGVILGLALDTSNETDGYGAELERNTAFIEGFVGEAGTAGVDGVAGSTLSSDAVKQAVENALAALGAAKEAA